MVGRKRFDWQQNIFNKIQVTIQRVVSIIMLYNRSAVAELHISTVLNVSNVIIRKSLSKFKIKLPKTKEAQKIIQKCHLLDRNLIKVYVFTLSGH